MRVAQTCVSPCCLCKHSISAFVARQSSFERLPRDERETKMRNRVSIAARWSAMKRHRWLSCARLRDVASPACGGAAAGGYMWCNTRCYENECSDNNNRSNGIAAFSISRRNISSAPVPAAAFPWHAFVPAGRRTSRQSNDRGINTEKEKR